MKVVPRVLVLALVVSSVLATPVDQTAPTKSDQAPLIRAKSHLVLVDVVATDKNGNRVSGLTEADFSLKEDGKPQKIAFLEPAGSAPLRRLPSLPPFVYTNDPAYQPLSGPITLILLDSLNTPRTDQARIREEMLKYFIPSLRAGRWTAVLGLTDSLVVLQDFTTSAGQIKAALQKFKSQQSSLLGLREQATSREAERERETLIELMKYFPGVGEYYESIRRMEENAMSFGDRERMQGTLAALRTIANAVAGFPGRKNLIWVSASFPLLFEGSEKQVHQWSGEEELGRTVGLLGAARVAVYPVDPRGLPERDRPEGEEEFLRRAQRLPPVADPRVPQNYWSTTQFTMKALAENTGGQAFYNRNDVGHGAARAMADASSYYTLGYYPENVRLDGRFRRIEVTTHRKGLRIRYRRGYYGTPLAPQPTKSVQGSDQLDEEIMRGLSEPLPSTSVVFRARVTPSHQAEGGSRAAVEFWLDRGGLAFDEGTGQKLDTICIAAAFSEEGKLLKTIAKRVHMDFDSGGDGDAAGRDLLLPMSFELPAEARVLRLLVRENHSGLFGRVDVPLAISEQTSLPH